MRCITDEHRSYDKMGWVAEANVCSYTRSGVVELEYGGPWSEDKLACIEAYARQYLRVMQNQTWATLHYVDAFAGCGRQEPRLLAVADTSSPQIVSLFGDSETDQTDACEFIEGSPIRVMRASLELQRGFDQFIFVDADRQSCSALRSRVDSEFGQEAPPSQFVCGDANRYLTEYAASYDSSSMRSLVFLDPYGCQVAWGTVSALADTQACDVWYLFPLFGVVRMLPHSGRIDPAWQSRLDTVLGTPEWRDRFYVDARQTSLFDEAAIMRDASVDRIVEFIVERLGSVFPGVANPAVLRNRRNSPMFALLFAVSNPSPRARTRALDIANHLTKGLNAQS